MPNSQAVWRDSLPAELPKLDHPNNIRSVQSIHVNLWKTGKVIRRWEDATVPPSYLTRREVELIVPSTPESRPGLLQAEC